ASSSRVTASTTVRGRRGALLPRRPPEVGEQARARGEALGGEVARCGARGPVRLEAVLVLETVELLDRRVRGAHVLPHDGPHPARQGARRAAHAGAHVRL